MGGCVVTRVAPYVILVNDATREAISDLVARFAAAHPEVVRDADLICAKYGWTVDMLLAGQALGQALDAGAARVGGAVTFVPQAAAQVPTLTWWGGEHLATCGLRGPILTRCNYCEARR
jgi:hypothetical protein